MIIFIGILYIIMALLFIYLHKQLDNLNNKIPKQSKLVETKITEVKTERSMFSILYGEK